MLLPLEDWLACSATDGGGDLPTELPKIEIGEGPRVACLLSQALAQPSTARKIWLDNERETVPRGKGQGRGGNNEQRGTPVRGPQCAHLTWKLQHHVCVMRRRLVDNDRGGDRSKVKKRQGLVGRGIGIGHASLCYARRLPCSFRMQRKGSSGAGSSSSSKLGKLDHQSSKPRVYTYL